MDVGVLDDQAIVRLSDRPQKAAHEVKAFITHRFGMGPEGLKLLKQHVDQICQKLSQA